MLALVAFSVVNAPVPGVVEPMAGGEAKNDEKPAPLTAPDADKVVNAPAAAVVWPIGVLLIEPPVIVAFVTDPLIGALMVEFAPTVTLSSDPPVILTASERSLLSDW